MKKKIYISIQILQIKQNKYILTKLHQICSFLHIKMGFPLQQRLQVYDYGQGKWFDCLEKLFSANISNENILMRNEFIGIINSHKT